MKKAQEIKELIKNNPFDGSTRLTVSPEQRRSTDLAQGHIEPTAGEPKHDR
jgi:hypothetical protein